MDTRNSELRRLIAWNALWRSMMIVVILGLWIAWMVAGRVEAGRQLHCYRTDDGTLVIDAPSDGPYIVTHIVTAGGSDMARSYAALVPPLAVLDRAGAAIPAKTLVQLRWRSAVDGETVPHPQGQPLTILYHRPHSAHAEGMR